MKHLIVLLVLFFAVGIEGRLTSQQVLWVGIPTEKVNYYAASQEKSQWCWAASIQMMLNYYGIDISQEQIVERTYGVRPDGELPDWAGSFEAITANLNNWSVDNNGTPYVVNATLNWGAPVPSYLVQELSNQRPVLIGYRSGPNSGHAVIITACSFIQTVRGPWIQTIVVRDPYPTRQNIRNLGRVEYPGSNLANYIQAHWYVRAGVVVEN